MRRQRGFTLMEILIAMALTAIVTTSVLAIVRTQLMAFEMNDQIMRTQQNARAGMDFVESIVRRACGGISSGWVAVNVPGATQRSVPCLQLYDGAMGAAAGVGGTSFGTPDVTKPDALDVVYATGTMTALTALPPPPLTATPSAAVVDVSQFAVGDYVLVGDFANAYLFKVSAVTPGPPYTTRPTTGTLSFGTLAGNVVAPTGVTIALAAGSPVFKAATYTFYVASTGSFANMLMIDANGVASTDHVAGAQPAVEGAIDFQVAIGNDTNGDGLLTDASPDEWIGNAAGETPLTMPTLGWNSSTLTTMPQVRQVRLSLVVQTLNSYPGTPSTLTNFEDRPIGSYPITTSGTYGPRYRSMRIVVAPRAWNLTE
jgi:prepilin-type N-terminal cleavage/methylation domain-containing protein